MPGLKSLANQFKGYRKKFETEKPRLMKAVAKAALKTLVEGTPVDTSQALSNWQVGFNRPTGTIPPYVRGFKGSTRSASERAAIAVGNSTIDSYKAQGEIHIANNLEYIEDLNNGTISQQPGAFVQKAILVGKQTLASETVKLK